MLESPPASVSSPTGGKGALNRASSRSRKSRAALGRPALVAERRLDHPPRVGPAEPQHIGAGESRRSACCPETRRSSREAGRRPRRNRRRRRARAATSSASQCARSAARKLLARHAKADAIELVTLDHGRLGSRRSDRRPPGRPTSNPRRGAAPAAAGETPGGRRARSPRARPASGHRDTHRPVRPGQSDCDIIRRLPATRPRARSDTRAGGRHRPIGTAIATRGCATRPAPPVPAPRSEQTISSEKNRPKTTCATISSP